MENSTCEILPQDCNKFDYSFKLIIIGDSGVGKSSLIKRTIKNVFESDCQPTLGCEFYTFITKINNNIVKCQIWDTCGQEKYRSLIPSFYNNLSLAIIIYAINDISSFDNVNFWLNELKNKASVDIKIVLIGNKADLEDERKISKEEAEKYFQENNFNLFFETSAKTGFNAKEVFMECSKILFLEKQKYNKINNSFENNDDKNIKINIKKNEKERKKKCCN